MDEISENIFDEELNKLLQAEPQRLQFLEDIQWTDQGQRESIFAKRIGDGGPSSSRK